jgi:tetratricopeptide (TPR) repeat protein
MAGPWRFALLLAAVLLCAAPAKAACNAAAEQMLQQALVRTEAAAWIEALAAFKAVPAADPACVPERWSPATLDRLQYADLQTGRDDAAKALLPFGDEVARAIMAARYVLERDAWSEAATLPLPDGRNAPALAIIHYTRALGAAREGHAAAAQPDIAALEGVAERDLLDAAKAWAALAEGRRDAALGLMRAATEREDATGRRANPLLPMRELLADMRFEVGDFTGALKEYEISLSHAPGRMRAFWGAGRAAESAGDHVKTQHYYAEFAALCGVGTCQRPGRLTALKRSMAHP